MPLPQVLKNFNLFIDGVSYAGKADEVVPPKLTLKTEEHRGAGMHAPANLEMGMEALEMEMTLADRAVEVLKLAGKFGIDSANILLRSAWQDDGGDTGTCLIEVRGRINGFDAGTWKPGDKSQNKFTVQPVYYRLNHDGKDIHEIDVINGIFIVDGVDQTKAIRDALDMA